MHKLEEWSKESICRGGIRFHTLFPPSYYLCGHLLFPPGQKKNTRLCYLLTSPLFIVVANLGVQTCSHSGGGMRVHIFCPDSWACHDGRSTLSIFKTESVNIMVNKQGWINFQNYKSTSVIKRRVYLKP